MESTGRASPRHAATHLQDRLAEVGDKKTADSAAADEAALRIDPPQHGPSGPPLPMEEWDVEAFDQITPEPELAKDFGPMNPIVDLRKQLHSIYTDEEAAPIQKSLHDLNWKAATRAYIHEGHFPELGELLKQIDKRDFTGISIWHPVLSRAHVNVRHNDDVDVKYQAYEAALLQNAVDLMVDERYPK